jgi:large subunit ribosomal protein L28
MSRRCEITGVGPETGNLVSHSNIKTRTRWLPNLKNKKYYIPELSQTFTLKLTTRAIRTIDKQGGISKAILIADVKKLSPRLKKLRTRISQARGVKSDQSPGRYPAPSVHRKA